MLLNHTSNGSALIPASFWFQESNLLLLLVRKQQDSFFSKGGPHHDNAPHLHSLLIIYENYLIAINSLLLFGDITEEEQGGLII